MCEEDYNKIEFSVVMAVCCRDSKSDLEKCLDSIYRSLGADDEVILVHDGPMDEAMIDFNNRYMKSNLHYFATLDKQGLTGAINLGVKNASKQWIARMDPDDVCSHDRFDVQRAAIKELNFPDVLSTEIIEFSQHVQKVRRCRLCNSVTKLPFWLVNPIYNVTTVFKKSVFYAVGEYEYFPNFIDYLFWIKILKSGYRVECIKNKTVFVNLGNDIACRRGGLSYVKSEVRFYKELYNRRYINLLCMFSALILRLPIRLFPKVVRTLFMSIRN